MSVWLEQDGPRGLPPSPQWGYQSPRQPERWHPSVWGVTKFVLAATIIGAGFSGTIVGVGDACKQIPGCVQFIAPSFRFADTPETRVISDISRSIWHSPVRTGENR